MPLNTDLSPFASNAGTNPLSTVNWIAWALVIIGAINWGFVGILGIDLVATIFGPMSMLSRIVYVLVGVAGLYFLSVPFQEHTAKR